MRAPLRLNAPMHRRRLGPMMLVPTMNARPALPVLTFAASLLLTTAASATSPQALAEAAEARLERGGPLLRNDCSGLVMTVLNDVGAPVAGNTRTYWAGAVRDNRLRGAAPSVGDLAFFDGLLGLTEELRETRGACSLFGGFGHCWMVLLRVAMNPVSMAPSVLVPAFQARRIYSSPLPSADALAATSARRSRA